MPPQGSAAVVAAILALDVENCAAMSLAEKRTQGMHPMFRHYKPSPWQKNKRARATALAAHQPSRDDRRATRKRQRMARKAGVK